MLRLTLANAIAHRSRLALTWLAVALGVAFATGSLVLTDTSSALLDEQFRRAATGVDVTVRTAAAFDAAMGVEVQRAPVQADVVDRVAALPGVEGARGAASGPGQLTVADRATSMSASTLIDTWQQQPYRAYRLVSGRAPEGSDEAVLDGATAREEGIAVGDTVTVTAQGSRTLRVVGLAGVGDGDGLPGTELVLVGLPTAQGLLGIGSGLTAVDVVAAPGTTAPTLRSTIATALGAAYSVTNGQDTTAASAAAAQQSVGLLRLVLLVLAGAGFVVGAFLIANTFGIVVAQRGRELALLRASGATGRQVRASVLGEAAVVGLAGSLAGGAAGIAAALVLRALASLGGLALPDGPLVVSPGTLATVVIAGTAVTVLSALGPARRAARTAPVEAMRASDPAAAAPGRARRATGWVVAGLGAPLLAGGAVAGALSSVALGAVLLLVSLALLAPVVAPRLASVVGRPLLRLGVHGALARESARSNPRRTAATAMALALGLALVTFVTVLNGSVKAAVGASYREAIRADLVVESSRNEMLGGLSPEVSRRADGVDGVALVSVVRYGHWLDAGVASAATAVDPATITRVADIRMVAGGLDGLRSGGVILAEKEAVSRGLAVGDRLAMTFPKDGQNAMPVVGVIDDDSAGALGSNVILSLDEYAQHYDENVDASVLVSVQEGADLASVRTGLERALSAFPNAQVRDLATVAASRTAALDQAVSMITVLLGFAVIIALLGITNTLALSIVERTREMGLLRAVGMTRGQLAGMIRSEAMLMAAIAVVTGMTVGLVLAAAVLTGLGATMPLTVQVPVPALAALGVGTLVAGVAAGVLPARRGARLDVLAAIATE